MLGFLFGWRKASKCKEVINELRSRLIALRSERTAMSEKLREEIALFLMNANQHAAFTKIEQLYVEESLIQVYEWLDKYCEFVLMNLPFIKRHRNCPNELNEAVSTLIFASVKLRDLPELQTVRKLFEERYGHKIANTALELLPGNHVNCVVKEKLCMKTTVSEDAKNRLLDEITREYLDPAGFIEIECNPSSPQEQTFQFIFPAPETSHPQDDSVVYLDNIEEFKLPAKKSDRFGDDQDRRMFIFKPSPQQVVHEHSKTKSTRKSQRRRSSSSSSKNCIYNKQPENEIMEVVGNLARDSCKMLDEFVPSFRVWLEEEDFMCIYIQ